MTSVSPPTENKAQPIPINTSTGHASPNASQSRRRSSSVFSTNPPALSPSSSPLSASMSALQTPSNGNAFPPRISQGSPPPGTTSPLAYFLSPSSPIKKHQAFPWSSKTSTTTTGAPTSPPPAGTLSRLLSNDSAIAEDDDNEAVSPLSRSTTHTGVLGSPTSNKGHGGGHFRSGSLNWHQHPAAIERAAGVMRRLSLSGTLGGGVKPSVSPPSYSPTTARVPSPPVPTPTSATTTAAPSTFRAPSPAPTPLAQVKAGERRGRARGMSESVLKSNTKRRVSPMGERMLKGHFDGFGL